VCLCLVLVCTVPADATEMSSAALTSATIDTFVVTGRALDGSDSPSTSSLVTRIDLEQESGFRSAAELLGTVAGFQVRRTGGLGSSAVPSLRGSTAGQIRIFLDGMPLNGARNGLTALENLPLDRVAAIEVHRGVVPTHLGGIGGAGAVNFVTTPGASGSEIGLRAGSFGELGGRAVLSGETGSFDGLVMAHGQRADNDFTFVDHNQTFHRTDDDSVRTRQNSWIEEWGAWGAGRWQGGDVSVRTTLGFHRREGGRPGPLGYESPNATVRYDRTDAQVHLAALQDALQLHLAGSRTEDFLYDPQGEVGFTPPGTTRSLGHDLAGRLQWTGPIVPGYLDAGVGGEARGQWGLDSFRDIDDPRNNRLILGTFASATLKVAHERLQVTPSWRWQQTRDDFTPLPTFPWLPPDEGEILQRDDVSPAVGAVWEVAEGRLFFESHLARTVRIPTWTELFGHRGGIDGNRDLQPETIESADLAVSFRTGRSFRVRAAAFHADTDDKIIFRQNSQRTSQAINAGRTVTRGLEFEMATALPEGFGLRGNVTWQKAEDRSGDPAYDGSRLPFLPDGEAHGHLDWSGAGWRPWFEVAWMSGNYRDRINTELNKAPERTLLNLGVAHDWYPGWLGRGGKLSASAEVVNLTDNDVYDVEGFPLPGRSWHAALKVSR